MVVRCVMNTKQKALNTKCLSFMNEDTFTPYFTMELGLKMFKALIVAHTITFFSLLNKLGEISCRHCWGFFFREFPLNSLRWC